MNHPVLAPYDSQNTEFSSHVFNILLRHVDVNCLTSLIGTNHMLPSVMYQNQSCVATFHLSDPMMFSHVNPLEERENFNLLLVL